MSCRDQRTDRALQAHWSWPDGYLEKALTLHTITPEYPQSNHCFDVLDVHDKLIASFSIVVDSARIVLDNLWVTPEQIGKGACRTAGASDSLKVSHQVTFGTCQANPRRAISIPMETNWQFVRRHGRSLVGLAIAVAAAAAGYGIGYETRPRSQQLDYAVTVNELAGSNSGQEGWTRPPIDSSEFAAELIATNAIGCGSVTTQRADSHAGELANYCAEIEDQ